MATPGLRLEIIQGVTTWTFAVSGRKTAERTAEFKRASNPPQCTSVLDVVTFDDAILVSSDDTVATLMTSFASFRALLETRSAPITNARIVDSGGTVRWQLGSGGGYERLMLEAWQAGGSTRSPAVEAASWRSAIPFRIRFSAVLKFADTNGIVGWDQEVRRSYDEGGLEVVEWVTRVTTAETSTPSAGARAKAIAYGLIPIALYGSTYSYLTNGDDGVEVVEEDSDAENDRVATVAIAVSRIREWGVTVGADTPGTSPSTFVLDIRRVVGPDEETITTTASATGPGAEQWVKSKVPVGVEPERTEELEERSTRRWTITWTQNIATGGAGGGAGETFDGLIREIRVEVEGGKASSEFEPTAGFSPVEFRRAISAWTVTVSATVEARGENLSRTALPLPANLDMVEGLRLDYDASREDLDPWVAERAARGDRHRWRREARVVYRSANPPPADIGSRLRGSTTPSYHLG